MASYKIPKKEKDKINKLYQELGSIQKVSELYNVSNATMWRFAKENNITIKNQINKKYKIDHYAFNILNEYSEYWIGFLFADGNIDIERKRLMCRIKSDDSEHIQKCLDFLKSDYKKFVHPYSTKSFNKQYKLGMCGFQITSSKIISDLVSYGFTKRKSWDGEITNKELLNSRHFWRGLIDGDGSIGYIKHNKPSMGLVASKKMSNHFINYIYKNILYNNLNKTHFVKKKNTKSSFFTHFDTINAFKLISRFYSNINISLDRKIVIANKIINSYEFSRKVYGHEEYSKIADMLIQNFTHDYIKNKLDVAYSTITMIRKLIGINEIEDKKQIDIF